jgi:hypothetical protein
VLNTVRTKRKKSPKKYNKKKLLPENFLLNNLLKINTFLCKFPLKNDNFIFAVLPDLDPDFLPIPDPNPGSQIPNPGIKKALDP